ncbi:hypothetical protein FRC03_011148 [Tulasnella sp. 419]|nr:hypothetical protein FRC03_011148 [Tulasnella sp. 419]
MDAFWADESIISNADDHTADPEDVEDLNDLLECLDIPLTIHSPTDLTPSLLIAILESILQQRLDPSVRNATTPTEKIIAMKVFLGVLSDDLLNGVDAEISDIGEFYLF